MTEDSNQIISAEEALQSLQQFIEEMLMADERILSAELECKATLGLVALFMDILEKQPHVFGNSTAQMIVRRLLPGALETLARHLLDRTWEQEEEIIH